MLVILTQLDMLVLLVLDIHMERDLLMLKLMPRFLPPHTLLDMLDTHTLLDMLDILMLLDILVIHTLLDMLVLLVLDIHMERDLLMLKLMPRFLPPHTLLDMLVILMLLDMLVILTQLDMLVLLEVAETTLEPLFLANYPQTRL